MSRRPDTSLNLVFELYANGSASERSANSLVVADPRQDVCNPGNNEPSDRFTPPHPGFVLQHVLSQGDVNQRQLARKLGITRTYLNLILNGRAKITVRTAIHLERVLEIPAEFWSVMQLHFELFEARERMRDEINQSVDSCAPTGPAVDVPGDSLTETCARGARSGQ